MIESIYHWTTLINSRKIYISDLKSFGHVIKGTVDEPLVFNICFINSAFDTRYYLIKTSIVI